MNRQQNETGFITSSRTIRRSLMGKQYNKTEKRKRRKARIKRLKQKKKK